MPGTGMAVPMVSLSEAQAYVRVETGEEEALLAGLVRTASAVCESFINQTAVARRFSERLAPIATWQRLSARPVRSIASVSLEMIDGTATVLPAPSYAVDIDVEGCGWVRCLKPSSEGRLVVEGTAGMALDSNDVPEPLRQGVMRLVAHLFASRDGGGGEPPAAVTALWRPYRRMRLS